MRVLIIAAGSAARLGEYATKLPKGLLDINGVSILQRQIDLFHKHGINDICIIIGPHKEKYNLENVNYVFDDQYDEHDVLFSLMAAKEQFTGEVITSYSDILFDEDILKQILEFKGDIGVTVDLDWEKNYENRTNHPISEADNILIDNEKIIKIRKNLTNKKSNQLLGEFIGLMKFSKSGTKIFVKKFHELIQNHHSKFQDATAFKKAYLTDMIQELIDNQIHLEPIFIKGKWCEIDTEEDLEKARKLFY